jgi:hypothetical protein
MGITRPLSLREFLQRFSGHGELKPQTYWMKDFSGSIPLDFVGQFENLEGDFRAICAVLGTVQISLPHEIRGSGEDFRKYYDKESIDLITEVYREEIELLGYSFD